MTVVDNQLISTNRQTASSILAISYTERSTFYWRDPARQTTGLLMWRIGDSLFSYSMLGLPLARLQNFRLRSRCGRSFSVVPIIIIAMALGPLNAIQHNTQQILFTEL